MKLPPPKKHPQVEIEEYHKLFRAVGYVGSIPAFSTYGFPFLGPLYPIGIAAGHAAGKLFNMISGYYEKKLRKPD